jgi:formylglycine-generating enzyme required for sulfatase activity
MKKILFICSFLGALVAAKANNIIIDNGKIKGQSILSLNSTTNTVDVQFDLRWNNSYRTGSQKITNISVTNGTTGHTTAPLVYIGTTGAVSWATGQNYTVGQMIVSGANSGSSKVYIITTAGTSGTAAPSATTTGANSITIAGTSAAKCRYINTVTNLNGSGTGATAYAVVSSGVVKAIVMTNYGSGYSGTPTITYGFVTAPATETAPTATIQKEDFYDAAWVFLKFRVAQDYISQPGASASGTTITVHSTQGLRKGMPVKVTSGSGSFDDTTVVTSVVDAQTFTVNRAPTATLGTNTIIKGTRMWEHGYLSATGHSIGTPNTWATGSKMRVGLSDETKSLSNIYDPSSPFNFNPAVGLFYYPGSTSTGTGDYSVSGASLRWNYAAHGLNDNQMVDIMVYGVEMVQIPSGPYYLGDGSTDNAQFAGSANTPYLMTSETATGTLGGSTPLLKTFSGGATQTTGDDFNNTTATQTLPDLYPKGVNGYFIMKYEMGQRQYKEFFNTLSPLQKSFHDISSADGKGTDALTARNSFSWDNSDPFSDAILLGDAYGDVACNYLSWSDGTAYADWAGLRPMSEFEFEKAARGTNYFNANEFAWGTTSYTSATAISNGGQKNEVVTTSNANANYGNVFSGPLRVGVFATSSTTNKETASSSQYGVMDLSGNLWERVVSVGNGNGRTFRKIHGDGILDEYGTNNVPYTPNATASGSGFRGGSYQSTATQRMRTSDRNRAAEIQAGRFSDWGFRCVRNIPASSEL